MIHSKFPLVVGCLLGGLWMPMKAHADTPLLPVTLTDKDRIMVLSPHPDDDILGCAGVIQEAVNRHLPVAVVYLTNGDNYEWAFMAYKRRPVLEPSEMRKMGLLRHDEAAAAENDLGVPTGQLYFLGYPDWGTEHIFMEHWGRDRPAFRSMLTKVTAVPYDNAFHPGALYKGESILADLEKIMADFRPTKIFVSHPVDAHRDHRTYYLFAQVALWDLEDRIRPMVFPYLVHYPHWPSPRGFLPDRSLEPPAHLRELSWLESRLSPAQVSKKRHSLELHRTQMAKDRRYLDSFVAVNELFNPVPAILLGERVPEVAAPQRPGMESTAEPEISSMTEISWRHLYKENRQLVFRMELSTHSLVNHPINLYAFGYRHDRPFADMPKLRMWIVGQRVRVFDQGRKIRNPGIQISRRQRLIVVQIPLEALGEPDHLIGTAWSRSAEEPFDARIWRAVDLRER